MRMIRSNLDEKEAAALAAYHASQQQAQAPQEPTRQSEPSASVEYGSVNYIVQQGDTLRGIAEWFYGDRSRSRDIHAANRLLIRDPEDLETGTVLKIPRQGPGKQLA